jgi:hypothetical protein
LQLTTKVRLSRPSVAAMWIRPAGLRLVHLAVAEERPHVWSRRAVRGRREKLRSRRYRLNRACMIAFIGPRPIETVGNSQKSGISRGCG